MKAILENANCETTHATFRVFGDTLVPDEVTDLLLVRPSISRRKGALYGNPKRPVVSRTGIWALESSPNVQSSELEEHIAFLLDKIGQPPAAFYSRARQEGWEIEVFCYWLSATGHGGPILSPRLLGRIAGIHAKLDFDFYSAV